MRVEEQSRESMRNRRYRGASAAFFANNPACCHRLVPWLNRELNVLLRNDTDRVNHVLQLILEMIKRYDKTYK